MNRRISIGLIFIGVIAILVAIALPNFISPSRGWDRLNQLELNETKDAAFNQMVAAGGWMVLKRECELILTNNAGYFRWRQGDDDSQLPPTIKALHPFCVNGMTPAGFPPVVQIKLSGVFSSGGRGHPYYGFFVVCGSIPADFKPGLLEADGSTKRIFKPITNDVFEIF
jgi:hypothetical protein